MNDQKRYNYKKLCNRSQYADDVSRYPALFHPQYYSIIITIFHFVTHDRNVMETMQAEQRRDRDMVIKG